MDGKEDSIEPRHVHGDSDFYVIGVSIEVVEVYPHFVNAQTHYWHVSSREFLFNFCVFVSENDACLLLDELADFLNLVEQISLINISRNSKIQIGRKPGVREISFTKSVATFQKNGVLQAAFGKNTKEQPSKNIIALDI